HNFTQLPGWRTPWFANSRVKKDAGKVVSKKRLFHTVGRHLRLDQNWQLFGPKPLELDGWFVIEGVFANDPDYSIDVRTGKQIKHTKPDNVAATYINNRWRKYLEKVASKKKWANTKIQFCNYLCREWNRLHGHAEQLERIRLWFYQERTRLPHIEQRIVRVNRKGCYCKKKRVQRK
ncbi:MAG: hypothetical protein N2C12_13215, partial [Planctomycetales bacterium]